MVKYGEKNLSALRLTYCVYSVYHVLFVYIIKEIYIGPESDYVQIQNFGKNFCQLLPFF